MRTFYVENFGCRATQADGAALETLLERRGMVSVLQRSQAELIILNTCTVTSAADADARATIRKVHREAPESRILVTGCYAQRAPEVLTAEPGVEWVVGNSHKSEIPDLVTAETYHGGVHVGDIFAPHAMLTAPAVESLADRARPNLKIQDGCNNRCAFCVIPFVRGNSQFSPVDQVLAQVQDLSKRYREVVLTGINLGRWGREPGGALRLVDLIRLLLDRTEISRIRLSSVEPMDWSDNLIELMAANPRVAPHAHMPLQSGSDRILRKMHRKYRPHHYADRVRRVREAIPDAAIGADVMTGFPGETDELFEESLQFIAGLPFTYLHVFTYSERPGTPAASMAAQVPMRIRRERNRVLREVGERKSREFRESMIGRELQAVTLEERPYALTGNYIRVELAHWPGPNRLVEARPVAVTQAGMREAALLPLV